MPVIYDVLAIDFSIEVWFLNHFSRILKDSSHIELANIYNS